MIIIFTKKQQYQVQMQAEEITVVSIQSLNEYVTMKILATKHNFKQHVQVRTKIIDANVKFHPVDVEIRQEMESQQYEQIVLQLSSAQLKVRREINQQLQTWDLKQFEQMIFGGCEICLLRTHYFSDCKNNIEQYLFVKDNFQIKRVQQENPEYDAGSRNWFIIKRVRPFGKQISQYVYSKDFNLMKIKNGVIFNLTQFHRTGRKYLQQSKGTQFQNIENIFRGTENAKCSVFLEFGYRLNIYIRIHFKQKKSLVEFVERILSLSLQECLVWDLQTHRALQCYWSDFKTGQFVQSFNSRFNNDIALLPKEQYKQKEEASACQSQDYLLIQTEQLNLICHKLLEKEIISFQSYWPRISSYFDELLYTWSVSSFTIEDSFKRFLKVISERRKKFTIPYSNNENKKTETDKPQLFVLYDYLCPNISYYLREFQSRLHYNDYEIQKGQQPKLHILDLLLWSYFQEVQSINKGNGCIIIKTKGFEDKPLKDFWAELLTFQHNTANWEDVFNTVTINTKKIVKSHENASKINQAAKSLLERVHYEPFPITECLGCSQFFYHNVSISRGSNTGALRLIPLASKIKDYESAIKEQICRMLNNHGGIILFNCTKQYGSIFPHGALITEKDKQGYENQIINLLNTIHPRPEINKNIIITFVPVVHHPLSSKYKDRKLLPYTGADQELKAHQFHYSLAYIDGLYVTRIKVVPTETSKVYMWLSEDSIYHLSGFYSKTTKRQYKIADLSKAIKLKLNKYYYNQKLPFRPLHSGNPFNHECVSPDPGVKISEKEQLVNVLPPNIPLEETYSHVSMLVARSRYLPTIKEKLNQKGVHCHIEVKFQRFKFKSAAHTAVLYHSVKFQEILSILRYNLSEFTFQGKAVLAIYVTEYIKLQESNERNRIKNEELNTIWRWLKIEFPNDCLRFFQFRKDKKSYQLEYFIKVGSKISTLFIYYLLNHHKIKAVFKNPQSLDRMSQAEKEFAFKEVKFERFGESKQYNLNETLVYKEMSINQT